MKNKNQKPQQVPLSQEDLNKTKESSFKFLKILNQFPQSSKGPGTGCTPTGER